MIDNYSKWCRSCGKMVLASLNEQMNTYLCEERNHIINEDDTEDKHPCPSCGVVLKGWLNHRLAICGTCLTTRPSSDPINPIHYKGRDVMDIIIRYGLVDNFPLANVVKYVLRSKKKGGLEDLKKARWYLDEAINLMEGRGKDNNVEQT